MLTLGSGDGMSEAALDCFARNRIGLVEVCVFT